MILKNFIVLEGIDGAGTTTQLEILKSRTQAKKFLFTAEPTKSETGIFLRRILKGEIPISNETSSYVFAADRNEHVNGKFAAEGNFLITGIREACEKNFTVVSDRYLFSSLAYQSVGCDPKIPEALNQFFPLPQLLFFFEIEPEISLERISSRGTKEIFEEKEFLKKTADAYKKIISGYEADKNSAGMKIVKIDATLPKEKIEKIIADEIESVCGISV
jgi:dTMP kinase